MTNSVNSSFYTLRISPFPNKKIYKKKTKIKRESKENLSFEISIRDQLTSLIKWSNFFFNLKFNYIFKSYQNNIFCLSENSIRYFTNVDVQLLK